jgi:hypothetical protein
MSSKEKTASFLAMLAMLVQHTAFVQLPYVKANIAFNYHLLTYSVGAQYSIDGEFTKSAS